MKMRAFLKKYMPLLIYIYIEDCSKIQLPVVLNQKNPNKKESLQDVSLDFHPVFFQLVFVVGPSNLEFLEDKGQLPSHKLHDHNLLIKAGGGSRSLLYVISSVHKHMTFKQVGDLLLNPSF